MKNYKYYYILASFLLLFSCSSKKKTEDKIYVRPLDIEMTAKDSAEIYNLVDQYANLLLSNDLKGASCMLNTVHDKKIVPFSDKEREGFVKGLSIFHVYDVESHGFIIHDEENNEVKLTVQIMPDGNIEKNSGVTNFFLNPVRIGGHWYLTLKDPMAEGVRDIYGTHD